MRPPNTTTNASQFYDAGHGAGMRQIAPKLVGVPINVLGEESEGGDALQAGERFDAGGLRRPERPLESLEARREIRDPQLVAARVGRTVSTIAALRR